jgi:hypothetical protein
VSSLILTHLYLIISALLIILSDVISVIYRAVHISHHCIAISHINSIDLIIATLSFSVFLPLGLMVFKSFSVLLLVLAPDYQNSLRTFLKYKSFRWFKINKGIQFEILFLSYNDFSKLNNQSIFEIFSLFTLSQSFATLHRASSASQLHVNDRSFFFFLCSHPTEFSA